MEDMPRSQTTTYRRVNITLPEQTLRLMARVEKGSRSRFLDEAVRHYVASVSRTNLRKRLREGARLRAERDLALAAEWFRVEEQAWRPKRK